MNLSSILEFVWPRQEISEVEPKISGLSQESLIKYWVNNELTQGFYLVLYDIDVGNKPSEFWMKLPRHQSIKFTNDIVVLKCRDMKELTTLFNSIEQTFAKVLGFKDGLPVLTST